MVKRILGIFLLLTLAIMPIVASEREQESSFDWSASGLFTSNYIWRGLNCGGPSIQLDATVNYKGLFANMWWNFGATDWTFSEFSPELDVTIGYTRWGLSVYYIHMYYFDYYKDGTMSKYFDFSNHERGGGGTTGEWRIAYNRSIYTNKQGLETSLNLLCGVRTFGRDGYYDEDGNLKRAYSTYFELGCDQSLGQNWTMQVRIGLTPAKSLYTGFQGDFAVTLIGLKLNKQWQLSYGSLSAFAHVMLQPWQVNKANLILPIEQAGNQKLNLAVGCSYGI